MRCPYCGGWHYGYGTPPSVNYSVAEPVSDKSAQDILKGAMGALSQEARKDPYERDVLPQGDGKLWEPRVYGTDERGRDVTASFGKAGTTREGHVMISDGHVPGWKFYTKDNQGIKGHDHIGPGATLPTQRGKYTGLGEFSDPN